VLLSAAVAGSAAASGQATAGWIAAAGPGCARWLDSEAVDPLHAQGDRVLDAHGRRYEPAGISVYGGLQQWNGLSAGVEQRVRAQIIAATGAWHANTVRLQVAQGLFFAHPRAFLAELDREVLQITCAGAIAVINDNTLFTTNELEPTAATLKFIRSLAGRYKDLNNVILDPFNEPRIEFAPGERSAGPRPIWSVWQAGGTVDRVRYVGMQALVDAIRATGAHNLIWVEGPRQASSLRLLGRYPLTGADIELEFHHPNLNQPSSWRALLRASTARPEVEGEEAQYSSTRPECYGSAYAELPRLLGSLASYHDGLVAWSLQPGVLVASSGGAPVTDTIVARDPSSAGALGAPTKLERDYRCGGERPAEGMGQLTMSFLRRYAAAENPYAAVSRGVSR